MKTNLRTIQKHRLFSEEFKRSLVKDFESGNFSVLQLEKLHKVSNTLIYRWIYKYSTFNDKSVRIIEMKESSTNKIKDLEEKVKELERAVGQKQLYIDYMEKMMEIAKEDIGIDIKKNFNTPQSAGSGKTKKR
jgi:transposase-like protein